MCLWHAPRVCAPSGDLACTRVCAETKNQIDDLSVCKDGAQPAEPHRQAGRQAPSLARVQVPANSAHRRHMEDKTVLTEISCLLSHPLV